MLRLKDKFVFILSFIITCLIVSFTTKLSVFEMLIVSLLFSGFYTYFYNNDKS